MVNKKLYRAAAYYVETKLAKAHQIEIPDYSEIPQEELETLSLTE